MNKVFLIGRLTRDPELRYTSQSNIPYTQISVAINRPVGPGKDPETDFINVIVWNKQAESLVKHQKKGRQIAIEGRIQTRNYNNNEGKKTYVTEVIASNVEFLGSSNDNRTSINEPQYSGDPFDAMDTTMDTTSVDNDPFASFGEKVEISDNELPF